MTDETGIQTPATEGGEDRRPREGLLLPIVIPLGAIGLIAAVLFGFSRILLGISHNSATVVALVVATAIMVVAGIVAGQKRVGGAALGSMLGVVAGVALMTGALAFLIVGPQKEKAEAAVVTLAAGPTASADNYDQTSLSFPADEPVDLEFDNQETGVEHNVAIFEKDPAAVTDQTPLFRGTIIAGVATTSYAVEPLAEGTYYFHCDVHPATMHGTITVAPGGAAAGPTIVAKNTQFDTDTIELDEQTATAITFDNKDAGTDHNIAIYTDDSLAENLFKGDIITGPATATYTVPGLDAGTYYFHCDVHPSMSGKVVVSKGGSGGADGGGGSPEPTPTGATGGAAVSIAASNTAFDAATLSFPVDTAVTLTFDNKDPAIPHNVAIYSDAAYTTAVFTGEVFPGPASKAYDVNPLAAGTYYFRCDVHPTQMTGTVQVT